MPPSKEDLDLQRKVDALRDALNGLVKPDPERGRQLLVETLAGIARRNEKSAA
jgi:hypothetical protein